MDRNTGIDSSRRRGWPGAWVRLGWLCAVVLALALLAAYRHATLGQELERESAALHAEASQRADQHDAHLTGLSAIAQSLSLRQPGPLGDVAATIMQFYPRIDQIMVVPLDPAEPAFSTGPLPPDLADTLRIAARSSTGHAALLFVPARPGHYLMVKRSPNNDAARYAVALSVDGERLLASSSPFWSGSGVARRLSMPDGAVIFGPPDLPAGAHFSRNLGSASQPLLLETAMSVTWRDLLPMPQALATIAGASLLYLAAVAMGRERSRARAAERRAALSDLDARLTHASRVNAMGEMAGGMTHELTQPLTAILAQGQAGRRLLAANNLPPLAGVLDDVVAQARRASAILDRLRNWSRPQPAAIAPSDLRMALGNVEALLAAETARRTVALEVHAPSQPVVVMADAVEMEQVIFNLIRNALEALADAPEKRISVRLDTDGETALLEVRDTGPGVPAELLPRLFTPFTTSRADGTGLGLALSQRLVERVGGEIVYVQPPHGALFRVTLPLAKGGPAR